MSLGVMGSRDAKAELARLQTAHPTRFRRSQIADRVRSHTSTQPTDASLSLRNPESPGDGLRRTTDADLFLPRLPDAEWHPKTPSSCLGAKRRPIPARTLLAAQ